jgi:hypothetical protein
MGSGLSMGRPRRPNDQPTRCDRAGQRWRCKFLPARHYPSDLTDAQWELIAPLLPPPSPLGRREKHDRRQIVTRSSTCYAQAAHGGICPKTSPLGRRCFGISAAGGLMAPWTESMTHYVIGSVTPLAAT